MKKTNYSIKGAYNSKEPTFYNVIVDSTANIDVLATDNAKYFYMECLKNALGTLPINIVSYAILDDSANFVISSFDQGVGSIENYLEYVNVRFSEFYNINISAIGYCFVDSCKTKKLDTIEKILNCIVYIHRLPIKYGISDSLDSPFSSYSSAYDASDIATLEPIKLKFSKLMTYEEYIGLHSLTNKFEDYLIHSTKRRYQVIIEKCMVKNNVFKTRNLSPQAMVDLVIDINTGTGLSFEKIIKILTLNKVDKAGILVQIVADNNLKYQKSYFETLSQFQIMQESSYDILKRSIILISDLQIYSYDNIINGLGIVDNEYNIFIDIASDYIHSGKYDAQSIIKKFHLQYQIPYLLPKLV